VKTNPSSKNTRVQGFTLIEMIGVLAVIAILAALLIPKIFEAINNARVNNAAVSYNTVKTACADHYAKTGSLLTVITNNAAPFVLTVPVANFDKWLLAEGFLDKAWAVKIGDGTVTNMVEARAGLAPTAAADESNTAYDLDGSGVVNDAGPAGSVVVQAIISGVTEADAKELNDRLDGPALGVALGAGPDIKGRVKYAAGSPTVVYMYVTHR
jgi:prepilin-type N-terminal cleavage/methylation domain-containing protein